MTADEIRERIINVTLKNGGHLASSLGAVEIAMALAEVFNPEKDCIVWDVGHQSYAWKILTGRNDTFESIRQYGGISGFPNPNESPADVAFAGHAGVAMSVAEGLAAARDLKRSDENVIAVIGDAALANGVSFEALNDCQNATKKLIIILNDNKMSISRPTGSLARLLGRIISGVNYNRVKSVAEAAGHKLRLTFLRRIYHEIESRLKGLILGNTFFEKFGVRYIGPIDGHNLNALRSAFTVAKFDKRSVIVHVVTKKGKGYKPAEIDPAKYHGISPAGKPKTGESWSNAFGEILCELAESNDKIVALTAAMRDGTGLKNFSIKYPNRFHDVGIAEEHLLAYAAGLAAGGMRSVVAVYSTFLQRAIDQVMHDICLANLPVVICVDRAGIVGADGVTHQGIYDIAMLRCLPNLTICQPRDKDDLRSLLVEALNRSGPTVIRYPRGTIPTHSKSMPIQHSQHHKFALWVTCDWYDKACKIAERLNGEVVCMRYLKPFDQNLLQQQRAQGLKIISLENAAVTGGIGEALQADIRLGWPDTFIPHGDVATLERAYQLDCESIIKRLQELGI